MASTGCRCPRCNCAMSTVKETRERSIKWRGKVYTGGKRVRECRHCGYRWHTIEMDEDDIDKELRVQLEE